MRFRTLNERLQQLASDSRGRIAYTFLPDGEGADESVTYEELDRRAKALAAYLQSHAEPGERALLLFPPGLEYIVALFGCLYSGIIAVPAYPPKPARNGQRGNGRLQSIVEDARPSLVLSLDAAMGRSRASVGTGGAARDIQWIAADMVSEDLHVEWTDPRVRETDLAFLQYTSGSTSTPKGVMISHLNILANERMIQQACGHTENSTFVGWLPLYHDMGLVGNVLQPLYLGSRSILMSPTAFLQKPVRWLEAITRYRARTSGGPNFAYDLCARKITAPQKEELDLSSWTIAFNGAEPVRHETLERFTSAFEICGFRQSTFYPCYGLAEASLMVTGGSATEEPVSRRVGARALEQGCAEVRLTGEGARTVIGCGRPVVDCKVLIVNPQTCKPVDAGDIGEIWVSGPSVSSGYWNQPEKTEELFRARSTGSAEENFLRTRDLGFMLADELFVVGRLQDLIIVRGQNYHPEDIEWTVQQNRAPLSIHTVAAFSVDDSGEEEVILLIEVDQRADLDLDLAARSVRRVVAEQHELQIQAIGFVRVGTLPKTSSGKIQRHICKREYLSEALQFLSCSRLTAYSSEAPRLRLSRQDLIAATESDRRALVEQFLQDRVCELARAAEVDPTQPLISAGLDSLAAVELKNAIETELEVDIGLERLLGSSSISDVADSIVELIEAPVPGLRRVVCGSSDLEYPLSYAQQASWMLYKNDTRDASYVMARAGRIRGRLDIDALERAFQRLAQRHPCLRTVFIEGEAEPRQVVRAEAGIAFVVDRATDLADSTLLEKIKADVNRPFDLEKGPVMRIHIYTRREDEHFLVLSLHHIVCDLWSFGIIISELGPLYDEALGVPASLPEAVASYQDFVEYQQTTTTGNEGERSWEYWRDELAGQLPVLDLPLDNPRPLLATYRAAEMHFRLQGTLRSELAALAREKECTLYMVLLAAFQLLLHRYSGQEEVIIGSPAVGRGQKKWSNLVGYFANMITLRSSLLEELCFDEFLLRVRKSVLGALKHQQFPFPVLVERLQPARELNRPPIFQVLFVFQTVPTVHQEALAGFALGESGARLQIGQLEVESICVEHEASEYDLILTLAEVDGELGGVLKYSADILNESTAHRLVRHFENLLREILVRANVPVHQLRLLDEAEHRQLLCEWNRTSTPHLEQETLVELFAEQVHRSPEAIALDSQGCNISYRELDWRANKLARYLVSLGVTPDVCVAVCLHRSAALIETLLAILKAGGAYVPLDPTSPAERLAYIIENAQAAVLITEESLSKRIPSGWARTVCLEQDGAFIAEQDATSPEVRMDRHNLAYAIYTSGSTGKPKGVAVTHQNVMRLVSGSEFLHWDSDDIYLQLAPLSFDASTLEIWGCLLNGSRLCVHPPQTPSLKELGDFINEHRVTVLWLTARLFDGMADWELESLGNVKQLLAGGEALSVKSVKKALAGLPECNVINGYGPTESTTFACCCSLRGVVGFEQTAPIGKPIANTEVYVLDAERGATPIGILGELYIGGEGLARGYFGRPDLTAESFQPHPYSAEAGARVYRTGDLVRWRGDGNLEFAGRLDHQVKMRGYRVELGEIEAALCSSKEVRQAVVILREDEPGDKRLVAYVVSDSHVSSDLREYLQAKLPNYMVPSTFVEVDEIPLTANGKVDRKALPEPEGTAREEEYVAPRTSVEEIVAGIFAKVLRVEQVGIHDNFFESGGHSLLATQVASRVRSIFGIELALRDLFEAPTVAGLAKQIEEARREGRELNVPLMQRADRSERLPLSFAQQRLWFIDQLEPESAAYNVAAGVRLKGELDEEALRRSFEEIVRRHEVLRTRFETVEGEPVQVISEKCEVEMPVVELSQLGEKEKEEEARERARREAEKPFDLSRGPLLRTELMRMGEEEHVLVVTMHHVVSDGWSVGVLIRELTALYEAYSGGEESPLEELEMQYADYAVWQREWLQGEVLEEELRYWREELRGLEPLELPTDRPRPASPSHRGGVIPFIIPADVTQELKGVSQREGVTLFMTLVAGFQLLMSKYSQQEEVAIGTDVANRNRGETEEMIGFFVNQLVLKSELRGELTFRDLLRRVREVTLGAYEHQDMPFEKLVEELQPERELSRTPLFQVKLVLQNAPREELKLKELEIEKFGVEAEQAKFDLSVFLEEKEGEIRGEMEYASDLFDAETGERLLRHLEVLLESAVRDAEQRVKGMTLLTEGECSQLVTEWNATEEKWAGEGGLIDLMEEAGRRVPDAVALVYEEENVTYAELHGRANQLAHYLRDQGVGPEVIVGICIQRSVEMLVAVVGVLKSGGGYLPLEPSLAVERLAYMRADAGATMVLTQEHLLEVVQEFAREVISLDKEDGRIRKQSRTNPGVSREGGNVAYVIYTSGTTGKPKAAINTYEGIRNRLLWMQRAYQLTSDDVVLQKTTYSFDVSVWELLWPVLNGGKLVMARPGGQADKGYLAETIKKHGVSLVHYVPTMLEVFLEGGEAKHCSSLRDVFSSGEALGSETVGEWCRQMGTRRLHNLYGPTEAAVDVTYWQCEAEHEGRGAPIGKPIANIGVYVLDEEQEVVPIGVYGELYIGGVGVGRGYLNRADLTAERYLPDASGGSGGRVYRTGDQVRWRGDGNLEFAGRLDHQVKVRGYRIELGEIEAELSKCSGVRQAFVMMREDEPGDKRLVAYVVGDGEVRGNELQADLQEKLPDYMVPSAFVEMEELPLTANGKLDRKKLPKPEQAVSRREYIMPRTSGEEILAGIFAQVLRLERMGIHDNFFEMGGHSLLATQAFSRVKTALGVELPLRILFEKPTVAGLAEQIEEARREGRELNAPLMQRADRSKRLPLSFAQQRLWFIDQLEPESAVYNVAAGVRLKGELDEEALRRSFEEIVRRHEVLRTRFETVEGEPVQVISEKCEVEMAVEELSQLGEREREEEARERARREAEKPFDLSRGPLLRTELMRMGEEEHVLVVTMHHVVSDGWSVGVLIRELTALYEAYSGGEESPLEELEMQYADYAVWQREWLQGEVLEEELRYWREELRGLEPLELPTDRPRPAVASHRGGVIPFIIPADVTRELKRVSQREGVTLFMTLVAGFQLLMSKYSQQEEVAIGTDVANRNRGETEEMIGFFVNQLVLKSELRGELTFRDLLRRVREVTLGAYEHQDMPFEKLVEELQPERELSRTPLFQVKLVLQNAPREELKLKELEIEKFGVEAEQAKFDVTLVLEEGSQGLTGEVEYATDLFERRTIERLVGHLRVVLERVVADPTQKIYEIDVLSEQERQQLLIELNATSVTYDDDSSIHELFVKQVQETPDATAVVQSGRSLSYVEVDRCSNRLAHYLRRLGVEAEVRVGLCMDRSPEVLIGILGILKAGGAYLPIDPKYPADRLAFMQEDSKAAIILTQSWLLERLPAGWSVVVLVDSEWEEIGKESETEAKSAVEPENIAYVVYTSGSTGKPKGVLVTHRGASNLSWAQKEVFQLRKGSTVLQFASLSFDAACWEWIMTLLVGGRLVMVEGEESLSGAGLGGELKKESIEVITVPPSVLATLPSEEYRALKTLVVAGEACTGELTRKWAEGRKMVDAYGPSETTVCATVSGGLKRGEAPNIGKPIGNTQAYVVDGEQRPVPMGVYGELHIGGVGVARGYLGRADLTAERFVPDGYGEEKGGRVYRTGDVVRWRGDGNLEFGGRLDHQVKMRGYRIELGEVEAALSGCKGVKQAVVIAREEERGEKRLVAYVVSEGEVRSSELRERLKAKLPEYMVPSEFVEMEEIPLTANGKVDRKALPEPGMTREEGNYVAARTAVEEIVGGIFAEVLRVEQVGIEENFFELGGHSLMATQVLSRVKTALAVEVALRELFEAPTVAGLAERIEEARREGRELNAPLMQRADRSKRLPLSFAQQRLWFIDQLEPESAAYNVAAGVRLKGELDEEALRRSFEEIVRRHEVLRTRFETVEGEPVQVISAKCEVEMPVVELSQLGEREREEEARERARREAEKPFDLSRGPLLRTELMRMGEEEHVLVVTMHHVVSDGWSVGVLIRELTALYEAYSGGEESPLEELEMQYADYAVWQREWLQGEVLEEELKYWREELRGLEPLELPTDRPRPAVASHRGGVIPFIIPADVTRELKGVSQREGVTLFMTLVAGFQLLMSKYSQQEEVAIGTDVANRNRGETEEMIGFFVNQLVLKSELRGELTFRDLLRRVREVTLGAYEHQDMPFEKLVEELQPERELSRTPLFQVKLVLQNAPREELKLKELEIEKFGVEAEQAKFDLCVFLEEKGGEIRGEMEYARELFDGSSIERMVGSWRQMLKTVGVERWRRLSEVESLSKEETEQVLKDGMGAEVRLSGGGLKDWIAQEAERSRDAVAVGGKGDVQLSYKELNERSNQVAHYLRRMGVGPETLVAVCMERSVRMVVALLGVVKTGGAYVPLDARYPRERLAYMMDDAEAAAMVTEEKLREELPTSWAQVVSVDGEREEIERESRENPEVEVRGENLAYVMYTSGSTGKPKGVMVTQRGLANYIEWSVGAYREEGGRGAPLHTSVSFDLSVTSMWTPLASGKKVELVEEGGNVEELAGLMKEERGYSLIKVTPAHLRAMREMIGEEEIEGMAGCVVIGGEALEYEQLRYWQKKTRRSRLINEYGPTEAVVGCCVYEVEGEESGRGAVPIGKPIQNMEAYVLDGEKNPTAVGGYGELYIGGVGLARGYWMGAEATAERFVPHPYSKEAGARVYRTGDMVRWRGDGNLEFGGRVDHQVKVRGYRIELGEVEAALSRCRGVRQAVVVAREEEGGEKRLVGYVVSEGELRIKEVRGELQGKLPEYMVPSAFVEMEEIPLTANGKIDRKALPKPEEGAREEKYEGARTGVEEILAGIFGEVLMKEQVGIHDNFFELGGDSILAIRIISKARRKGLELTVQQLFQNQTVAMLSEVGGLGGERKEESGPVEGAVGLTPIQQWFFGQGLVNREHYNQALIVELKRRVPARVQEEAIRKVLEQHDALRMRFEEREGKWEQRYGEEEIGSVFRHIDLRGLGEEERGKEIERKGEEIQRSLKLEGGPIIRVASFEMGEGERQRMLMVVHHLVMDGVSWRILLEDLESSCEQLMMGEEVRMGGKTSSMQEWARALEGKVERGGVEEEKEYWKRRGRGWELERLPREYEEGENRIKTERVVTVEMSEEETEALLQEVPKRWGTQIQEVMMMGVVEAVCGWSGQKKLVVEMEGHGREEVEKGVDVSRTVGWFTTIYPMELERVEGRGLEERLREVRERAREAAGRGMSYGLLRYVGEDVEMKRELEKLDVAEVNFNYLGQFDQELGKEEGLFGIGRESVGATRDEEEERKHLIEVSGVVSGGRLKVSWSYSEAVHREETMKRIAREFEREVREVVESSRRNGREEEVLGGDIDTLLSPAELDRILSEVRAD